MRIVLLFLFALTLFCGCAPQDAQQATSVPKTTTQATLATEQSAEVLATSPTAAEVTPIDALLDSMTVEEKVGQLFLARCPEENAMADIQKYHFGGYILFARDFENHTPDTIRPLLAAYQQASEIPLLLAVDEEGGDVVRISRFDAFRDNRFPSPRKLYDQGGLPLVLSAEKEKCMLLKSLGINVNVGPVCDITTDRDSFMYHRSLGQDPQTTASFVTDITTLMQDSGIGAVLKHFPGYGNNTDTHFGMALDTRSLAELQGCDLIPFQAGIDAGNCAIMVSHTIVACMDDALPASLSPAVNAYLRETMGFNGVLITDDLCMGAITQAFGDEEAAVMAVLAGNDLLCSSNYPVQYAAVLEAVNSGRISAARLDASVRRILLWKQQLGILSY